MFASFHTVTSCAITAPMLRILFTRKSNYKNSALSVTICDFLVSRSIRTWHSTAFVHILIFFRGALLVLCEIRAASEMPVTFVAVLANMGERARRAGHAVATLVVAGVHDVTCKRFVACFTHVPSSRSSSKICDHLMSFDIVVQ